MRVFISWSGDLSRETAEALRKILPLMIQDLTVFLSKHDIGSGARWFSEMSAELQESSFGILCLTPTNQDAPWLLFEAGALAKHMEGRPCGLLLGSLRATDVSGPLAQFQHREFNKKECFALVKDINSNTNSPLNDDQVAMVFEKWWPDLESDYQTNLKSDPEPRHRRDPQDIVEELLLRVRTIEAYLPTNIPYGQIAHSLADLSRPQQHLLDLMGVHLRRGNIERVESIIATADKDDLAKLVQLDYLAYTIDGGLLFGRRSVKLRLDVAPYHPSSLWEGLPP